MANCVHQIRDSWGQLFVVATGNSESRSCRELAGQMQLDSGGDSSLTMQRLANTRAGQMQA